MMLIYAGDGNRTGPIIDEIDKLSFDDQNMVMVKWCYFVQR